MLHEKFSDRARWRSYCPEGDNENTCNERLHMVKADADARRRAHQEHHGHDLEIEPTEDS